GWLTRSPLRALISRLIPYHDGSAIDVTAAVLRSSAAAVRARGALPLFVMLGFGPDRALAEHDEGWIARTLFEDQKLPYGPDDSGDSFAIPGDGNAAARGARKIADATAGYLRPRLSDQL